jgi:hypothetical protein
LTQHVHQEGIHDDENFEILGAHDGSEDTEISDEPICSESTVPDGLSGFIIFHKVNILWRDWLTEIDDTFRVFVGNVTECGFFAVNDSIENTLSNEIVDIFCLLRKLFK